MNEQDTAAVLSPSSSSEAPASSAEHFEAQSMTGGATAPAHGMSGLANGVSTGGSSAGTASSNGAAINGAAMNGAAMNGAAMNGAAMNGAAANGGSAGGAAVVARGGEMKDVKPAPERKRPGRLSEDKRFKIFSGTANKELAEEICKFVGVPLGETRLQHFSDGEIHFQLLENVRGADVFVVQPTSYPVDQHLVELLIMIDALKRASASRITVVIPYYGYARQDRKDRPRVAISSKLVADLLTTAGANRALLVDLHAAQIQGFFNIPVDHLFASPVLVTYFRELHLSNLTVVSPDAGGVERARFFAKKLDVPLAIVDKRRTDINVTEVMNVIGDVKGRTCLILDDIVDTAGTLVKTVDALLAQGADKVYACASHAVLSGPAVERIASSRLEQLIVSNTIPLREDARKVEKIKVLSIAGLLGRAIESIHMETSVSTLFS